MDEAGGVGSSASGLSVKPGALDALNPPSSYSSKWDTDPVAHKLPTGDGLNQNDKSSSRNPKGLNREKEREKVAIGSPELQRSGSSSLALNVGPEGILQSHSSPLIYLRMHSLLLPIFGLDGPLN